MEIRTIGDVEIAVMESKFDSSIAKDEEAALIGLIQGGAGKVICDLSGTEYISSAGLRILLLGAKTLQASGGRLVLCCLRPYVHEIFETAGFTRIFDIYDSEEDALKSFEK